MKVICGWCQKPMGTKPGEGVTHSICPTCLEKQERQLEEMNIADGVHPFTEDPAREDRFTVIIDGEQVAWAETEAQAHRSYAEMLRIDKKHGED